jgi:AAA ATPase domain
VTFGDGAKVARPKFFGRARELGELTAALAQAIAGRGQLVLVAGEPGIGKTRLVDELTAEAGVRDVPVLWGRSWEAGGAPGYFPWLAVLEGLARRLDDSALRDAVGPGAGALAAIVPELEARLGPATATPPSPEEARFRLYRAVAGLVRQAAAPASLIIVFEDLHAADESSLALLHFVAREVRGLRLLIVATFRDAEAYYDRTVGELLTRIAREGQTLALPRLDEQAADLLLAETAAPLAPALSAKIIARAQGNPLFLQELARLVDTTARHDADDIPAGVREVIRTRLDRVPPAARAVLDLAAVAGDEIDATLLAAAAELPRATVVGQLDEACRAGVLKGRPPKLRFSHALVRETLYQALSEEARQTLHGQVAAALTVAAKEAARPRHAELAHHLLCGPVERLPEAVEVAIQAARAALAQFAYEEALLILERAAAAVAAAGDPAPLRAKIALALGAASIRRGDAEVGKAYCREAARLGRTLADANLLAEAALTYGKVLGFGIVDPVLVDLIEEALTRFPGQDEPLRIALQARLAAALQPTRKTEEPVAIAREAIVGARRVGDRRLLLETLQTAMAAMMDVAPPRERLALNLETEQLALGCEDPDALLRVQGRLVVDHMGLGQFGDADARIATFEAMAKDQHAVWVGWRGPLFRSMRAMIHGRFAEAEALIDEATKKGSTARDPSAERLLALHRESLNRVAERHEALLAQEVACRRHRANFFAGHAWQASASALTAARIEDAQKARFHLDLIPADSRPPIDNLFAVFHLAEPVAFVGDTELAARLHALVAACNDEDVMLGMAQLSWEGPTTRLLALLEMALGRCEDANRNFTAALTRLAELDARPLLARTRYEFGRALVTQGDAARGTGLMQEALAAAEELALPGLVRLCRARLENLPRPTARPAAPAPAPRSATAVELSNEGEVWALRHADTVFRLKDSLGLRYLARLVAEPDRELHVLDLVGGESSGQGEVADAGDAGELLDDAARETYRRRVADLREELEEAESFGDPGRAARAREELEFLTTELSRAVGLGGRTRRAGSAAERARSAVQRRIKNALQRIEEQAPALAAHLTRTVKTGNFCVYRPGSDLS